MKLEKFFVFVQCMKCGSEECTISLGDNGACNDPECCGGATYHIGVSCNKCGEYEEKE